MTVERTEKTHSFLEELISTKDLNKLLKNEEGVEQLCYSLMRKYQKFERGDFTDTKFEIKVTDTKTGKDWYFNGKGCY